MVVVAVYLPAIAAIFTGTGATWVINTFAMLPCVALLTNTPEKKNRYYVFDLTRKKKSCFCLLHGQNFEDEDKHDLIIGLKSRLMSKIPTRILC